MHRRIVTVECNHQWDVQESRNRHRLHGIRPEVSVHQGGSQRCQAFYHSRRRSQHFQPGTPEPVSPTFRQQYAPTFRQRQTRHLFQPYVHGTKSVQRFGLRRDESFRGGQQITAIDKQVQLQGYRPEDFGPRSLSRRRYASLPWRQAQPEVR